MGWKPFRRAGFVGRPGLTTLFERYAVRVLEIGDLASSKPTVDVIDKRWRDARPELPSRRSRCIPMPGDETKVESRRHHAFKADCR
jgi:hypothetical protein